MYVYIKTEAGLWTVGFYSPDGEFQPESDHSSIELAADRAHWLNGGGKNEYLAVARNRWLDGKKTD